MMAKLEKMLEGMTEWQTIALAFVVALVLFLVIILLIFGFPKRKRQEAREEREEVDPFFEGLNQFAATQVGEGQREQRRERRRICLNPFKVLKKHWFWASFVLFWGFIIIISILYEKGIVR